MGLFRQCFKADVKFLTQKQLPRLAPLAGGQKFATQISPLLNYLLLFLSLIRINSVYLPCRSTQFVLSLEHSLSLSLSLSLYLIVSVCFTLTTLFLTIHLLFIMISSCLVLGSVSFSTFIFVLNLCSSFSLFLFWWHQMAFIVKSGGC